MAKRAAEGESVIIKKYANRRLYNTSTSAYVTLEDLSQMVHDGVIFEVKDAKTGEDITRTVLGQIIFEQESRGGDNLLPVQFLRQLIRFYGDSMKTFLPSYLEMSIDSFARQQDSMQKQFGAMGGGNAYSAFEEMTRQNMAIFQDAMRMFLPQAPRPGGAPAQDAPAATPQGGGDIEALRKEMEAMRARLDKMSGGGTGGA